MSAAGWFWVLGPPGTPVNTCTNIMLGSQFWTDKQKYQCSKYIHIQKNRVVGFNVSCHKNVTSCGVVGICAPTDGSFPMLLLLISTSYTHRAVVCSRLFLSHKSNHLTSFSSSLQFVLHRWNRSCFTSSSTFILHLLWRECNNKRRIWGTLPQQGLRRCGAFSFLRFRLWKLLCPAALVRLSVPQMASSCRPSVSTTSPPDADLMPNSAVT